MVETLLKQMFSRVSKRTQEVLWRRFGLKNNQPETLEAIGRSFGITRERVRQIEAGGLKSLSQNKPETFGEFITLAQGHLEHFGGAREEKKFLHELRFATGDRHPAAPSRIRFLLLLSQKFRTWPESVKYNAFWSRDQETGRKVLRFLDQVVKELKKKREPLHVGEVEDFARQVSSRAEFNNHPSGTLLSYLNIAKELGMNPFGHFGWTGWAEIVPKGVRDRAYLVLAHHKKPLHFHDLAKKINEHAETSEHLHPAWRKAVEIQTVHNELIKDENFVLVGRGMYALKEWGFEPGTVRDLIEKILRTSRKSLTKEEVIGKVKEKRLVQENTILINLQNRRFFQRTPDGRYKIRGHSHITEEV